MVGATAKLINTKMKSRQQELASSQREALARARDLVETNDGQQLVAQIQTVLSGGFGGSVKALKQFDLLLAGFTADTSPPVDEQHRLKRIDMILHLLDWLKESMGHSSSSSSSGGNRPSVNNDFVVRIRAELRLLDAAELVRLVDYLLERVRLNDDEGMSWLELLPQSLEQLDSTDKTCSVSHQGRQLSGHDYKLAIVRSLCKLDWHSGTLAPLAHAFAEILETDSPGRQLLTPLILSSMLPRLAGMPANKDLPPLVRNLLRFADTAENCARIFAALAARYKANYEGPATSVDPAALLLLRDEESNVLCHVLHWSNDNHAILDDYLKKLRRAIKAPQRDILLQPFTMSMLLQLSDSHGHQAVDLLEQAHLGEVARAERCEASAWLRHCLGDRPDVAALDTVLRVVDCSIGKRQLVLQGLFNFGFSLLGSEPPRGAARRGCPGDGHGVTTHLPWQHASRILQKISRQQQDLYAVILTRIIKSIIYAGPSASTVQYTDYLARACREVSLHEDRSLLSPLMESMLLLPPATATDVMRALLPLVKNCGDVRRGVIAQMRGAMTSSLVPIRQLAVMAFAQLLKNLKVSRLVTLSQSGSLARSQVSSSASSLFSQSSFAARASSSRSSNAWESTKFCREIVSLLQRCLKQQVQVRSRLYQELCLATAKSPTLADYVVELLLDHFQSFYVDDEATLPPVKFAECYTELARAKDKRILAKEEKEDADDVVWQLHEPLGNLVFALQKLHLLTVGEKATAAFKRLDKLLESLGHRMEQTDFAKLDMGYAMNLAHKYDLEETEVRVHMLPQAIATYEALLAHRVSTWSLASSQDIGKRTCELFRVYDRLVVFAERASTYKVSKSADKDKKANVDIKAAGGRPARQKPAALRCILPPSVMDLATIDRMLLLIYDPDSPHSRSEQTEGFRDRIEIQRYALRTCTQLVRRGALLQGSELRLWLDENRQHIFNVLRTLYLVLVNELNTVVEYDELVAVLMVECFRECLERALCAHYVDQLPALLHLMLRRDTSGAAVDAAARAVLRGLERAFVCSLGKAHAAAPRQTVSQDREQRQVARVPALLLESWARLARTGQCSRQTMDMAIAWLHRVAVGEFKSPCDQARYSAVGALVVRLLLELTKEHLPDIPQWTSNVCADIGSVCGTLTGDKAAIRQCFAIIDQDNVREVYSSVNGAIAARLGDVTALQDSLVAEHAAEYACILVIADAEQHSAKEQSLCQQLVNIMRELEQLANVKMCAGPEATLLLRNLGNAYKSAGALANYAKARFHVGLWTLPESKEFMELVRLASNTVGQTVSLFVQHIESKQPVQSDKNSILRDTAAIPQLVKAQEAFHTKLVQLIKKTASEKLADLATYDSIRDFRINTETFMENLERLSVSANNNTTTMDRSDGGSSNNQSVEAEEEVEMQEVAAPTNSTKTNSTRTGGREVGSEDTESPKAKKPRYQRARWLKKSKKS